MKKVCIAALVFVSLALPSAYAHPPSAIDISYNPVTKVLTVVITHQVSTPLTHYIKKVEVAINGKQIITQSLSKQDSNTSQTVIYYIPDAKKDDWISVEASCSIAGRHEAKIKVQQ